MNLDTTCRVPATPHRATILDASYTGCRLQVSDSGVLPGATIHFELGPRSRVSGQVVWTAVGSAGVHFHEPLRSDAAIRLGLEQPIVQEITIEPPPADPVSLPGVLHHWFRRICGLSSQV